MSRLGLAVAALLVVGYAGEAFAQRKVIAGPPHFRAFQEYEIHERFTRAVLRNGLTLLIEENHMLPVATLAAHVGNQGLDDRELAACELSGRLWMRRMQASGEVYQRGGRIEFSSDADGSLYLLTVPRREVVKALEVHAEFLARPEPGPGVAALLNQLRKERRLRESRPRRSAERTLLEMGSLPKAVRGWDSRDLERLAEGGDIAARLAAVHKATHRPENIVVVVTGAVFAERLLKTLVEQYAPRRGSGKPERLGKAPSLDAIAPAAGLAYRHVREGGSGHLILAGLPAVGWSHPDFPALQLIRHALASGRASLLHRYAIEPGAALQAEAQLQASADKGLLSFSLAVDPDKVDAAEAALLTQFKVLRERELTPLLLKRAKALLAKRRYQRRLSPRGSAQALIRAELRGDYKSLDAYPLAANTVSAEDIQKAAQRYLALDRLALLERFPSQAEERTFDSKTFGETMSVLAEAGAARQSEAMNVEAASADDADLDFEFKPDFEFDDLERTSILRGPQIFYQERHDLPLFDFGLFFTGGRVDESANSAGITELMLRALLHGTRLEEPDKTEQEESDSGVRRSERDLPFDRLEAMGAEFEIVNETDFFGYRATLLAPFRQDFLDAVFRWLRRGQISDEAVELEKRRMLEELRRGKGELSSDLDWVRRQLFIGQPYGKSPYGTAASLATLGGDSARAWKASHIDKRHPWLLMRGHFKGTTLLRPFISRLSSSRLESVALGRPPEDPYAEAGTRRPETAGEEVVTSVRDGQIVIGYAGPAKATREEWMLEIFENLLEGVGGRLKVLLQEDAENAVPIRLIHESGQRKGAIFALAEADPEKADEVQEEIVRDLAALKDAVIRPMTWRNALVAVITDFHRRRQAPSYTLELARNILAAESTKLEASYINAIRQAKPADLQSLALIYFPAPD